MTALQTFLASLTVFGVAFLVAFALPFLIPDDRVTVALWPILAGGAAVLVLRLWWAYAQHQRDPSP